MSCKSRCARTDYEEGLRVARGAQWGGGLLSMEKQRSSRKGEGLQVLQGFVDCKELGESGGTLGTENLSKRNSGLNSSEVVGLSFT